MPFEDYSDYMTHVLAFMVLQPAFRLTVIHACAHSMQPSKEDCLLSLLNARCGTFLR